AAPPGQFTVGDPLTLKLTVTHPAGAVFDTPDVSVLAASGPGGSAPGGEPPLAVEQVLPLQPDPPTPGETSWSIRVRPFVPGEFLIPALELRYREAGSDERRSVATEPITFRIASVLRQGDETPADIRGMWSLPRSWWLVILVALAALAAAVALYRFWKKRRARRPAVVPELPPPVALPVESPYDRAVRELEALLASGLLAQGRFKEFHVGLAEIVKRFLGALHGFDAAERTTEEVMEELSRLDLPAAERHEARHLLESCDLVKFARHRPDRPAIDATIEAARLLIASGRPRPEGREEEAA
ncbi:MAG TPA: hypothetical protein VJV23_07400, partial [Candidatus Polarisedimenticolia bacterium]|nr:hypothetical protein [Candidatus Polarisedimenticolia bacterium]